MLCSCNPEMSLRLFSAEIACLYVKLLPYLDLSNLLFVCFLSVFASGDLTRAGCERAALPCSRVVPSHATAVVCPSSFRAHLGESGMAGGFDLVELMGSTGNRTQISCLSLSGSICHSLAAALFILPCAWLEVPVDEFCFQGVNTWQPSHTFPRAVSGKYTRLPLNI